MDFRAQQIRSGVSYVPVIEGLPRHILMVTKYIFVRNSTRGKIWLKVGSKKSPSKQANKQTPNQNTSHKFLPACLCPCNVISPFLPPRDGFLFLLLESVLGHINCFGHWNSHKCGTAEAWKVCVHWHLPSFATFGNLRARASLLEDERHHEIETNHLLTTRRVNKVVLDI